MKHGVSRKRSTKRLKYTENQIRKKLLLKRCLLILDRKPFKSLVKRKHLIGEKFQSLAVPGKKLLI